MSVTIKKVGRHGGPGRGGGPPKSDNPRIQTQVYIPYSMRKKALELRTETGESLSSTIVYLIDLGLSTLKNKSN